ncbi:MAG: M23 family metallopeptidase [Ginsengibacter sp.]
MKRTNDKTTILFVSKNQQAIRPIQVSSRLISNWKSYLVYIGLVFATCITAIAYLASDRFKQFEVQAMLTKKIHSMHIMIAKVDTSSMREKFTTIDKELETLNGFLKARGIKAVSTEPMGGESDSDIESPEEIISFYETYLKKINYNISYTPLGYPYPGNITSTFGHRENPFSGVGVETHKGLDIKGPSGAPVKSMAKGKVEFAGLRGGYGNCIILKHANGFETLYGHLSKIKVQVGQQVDIGQQIGNIGSTGRSTGPHLHYEVHRNGDRINPQSFLTLN